VPVGLDVGTLGDGAAHGADDGGDLFYRAADRVDQAGRRRARGKGGVDPLGGELCVHRGGFERQAAGLDRGGQGVAELV
jgi:hypothetical protein